ncbi:hypothetical protein [Deinococcus irradiatisoli]|nr:hypothetical protein [Deinococcus irradiatisoli]
MPDTSPETTLDIITSGDVEISREDGGLIVHEIGAAGYISSGLGAWAS